MRLARAIYHGGGPSGISFLECCLGVPRVSVTSQPEDLNEVFTIVHTYTHKLYFLWNVGDATNKGVLRILRVRFSNYSSREIFFPSTVSSPTNKN